MRRHKHTHSYIHAHTTQMPKGTHKGTPPQLIASYVGHTDSVESVAVSPDGSHLVSSGWDGSLRVWRMGQVCLCA
jgi:WD40 repeat protein